MTEPLTADEEVLTIYRAAGYAAGAAKVAGDDPEAGGALWAALGAFLLAEAEVWQEGREKLSDARWAAAAERPSMRAVVALAKAVVAVVPQ